MIFFLKVPAVGRKLGCVILLEWAQGTLFENASKIRPTLPEYVLDARLDGSEEALSPAYVRKIIRASYNFLKMA